MKQKEPSGIKENNVPLSMGLKDSVYSLFYPRLNDMLIALKAVSNNSKPGKVFFVLSTGRCGTRYISNLLNLADNATVLHQPAPGCESINHIAFDLYLKDKGRFKNMKISDFQLLKKHLVVYKTVKSPIYGDCHNSIYPFAIPIYHYFAERNVPVKFIHLIRHPVSCCASILRAEGPHGIGPRKNFGLRAKSISTSSEPAIIASDIWIHINRLIRYELEEIEKLWKDSSVRIHLESLNHVENVKNLFRFLDLTYPGDERITSIINNTSDEVRHSHQKRLDAMGIEKVTDEDIVIIRETTREYLGEFSYAS